MSDVITTPNQLAEKLAGSDNREKVGKTIVRPMLRKYFTREASNKGKGWVVTPRAAAFITAAFEARRDGAAFDADAWLKANTK